MVTLYTERMIVSALTKDQLELALHDPAGLAKAIRADVPPEVFSEESRQAMTIKISRMDHADPRLHAWYTYFLLVRSADRLALGVCGFKGAPSLFGSVELGYAIHEQHRNTGYMTEAVRALVAWAFQQENCRRVTAETLRDNHASQRVLQKAGMVLDHAMENMLYWKIDRETWEEQAQTRPSHARDA
jgi:RimJ/RimL family protein N-acetyltransferase